jgi:hypothetical protein
MKLVCVGKNEKIVGIQGIDFGMDEILHYVNKRKIIILV